MLKPKILISEDEVIIAENLINCLEGLGYETCTIKPGEDALTIIREKSPDLVLLTICAHSTKDGIETGMHIKQEFSIPVIYLTTHADTATLERAKKTEPAGLLLKPYNENSLRCAIEIALYNHGHQHKDGKLNGHPYAHKGYEVAADYIFVKVKHRIIKVLYKHILWVEAYDNYSFIVTADQKYLVSSTLKDMEGKLPPHTFVRVHRSYIANLDMIEALEENSVVFAKGDIPIGKSYKKTLMSRFNII
ncbi:LytR/AlgR family response regulator transcription factor [Pontibacter arcticus]|uniref:DNA-binding response regulator n=1 Tax=Pontibacter arcticus TaxID=2080288 RepID=A0A364RHT9_9BACT|nr:LytTR family transcriptional regulator DNA-binding domain-containing protein [Pontibacter arcticus]RAU83900.1 DNA-binding response regulator [Pontibacter arcticus]